MSAKERQAFDVSRFQWGPADLDGTTDTTCIQAIFAPCGKIRVLGYDMGPETQRMTGHYDYGYWIEVPAEDARCFVAGLLNRVLGGDGACTFDQLKDICREWGINVREGDGPYSSKLEVLA